MSAAPSVPARAVLIAQMTDIHVGFDPAAQPEELNLTRFRITLDRLLHGPNVPDLLVLSGDITDHGDAESFAREVQALNGAPMQGKILLKLS